MEGIEVQADPADSRLHQSGLTAGVRGVGSDLDRSRSCGLWVSVTLMTAAFLLSQEVAQRWSYGPTCVELRR